MKITHTTTAALALALSLFVAHGAAAQYDTRSAGTPSNPSETARPMSAPATPLTATGKVVTKNADSVIVLTDAGDRVTVYTDASSVLPTATWAVGDRVTVSYTTPTIGRNHAESIVIATAPAADDGTTTTTTTTTTATDTTDTSSSNLPRTASSTPLVLLLGSFAGAAAVALHLARRAA